MTSRPLPFGNSAFVTHTHARAYTHTHARTHAHTRTYARLTSINSTSFHCTGLQGWQQEEYAALLPHFSAGREAIGRVPGVCNDEVVRSSKGVQGCGRTGGDRGGGVDLRFAIRFPVGCPSYRTHSPPLAPSHPQPQLCPCVPAIPHRCTPPTNCVHALLPGPCATFRPLLGAPGALDPIKLFVTFLCGIMIH